MIILRCSGCGYWLTVEVDVILLPESGCPHCGATKWRHFDTPKTDYKVSKTDAQFLRSLNICAEV